MTATVASEDTIIAMDVDGGDLTVAILDVDAGCKWAGRRKGNV
eukprot:CAMPEP_0198118762 /NCGR_PEP_ID=MMETSP1442-20131203/22979_1 /TAXON_ID= /ORGANISM="Craspedostauros australis, Strain CCMP3328" /LENGTH=42 /DNA_ID= /DNA_START= /DNA_END= /DNA_ORIENTATION=